MNEEKKDEEKRKKPHVLRPPPERSLWKLLVQGTRSPERKRIESDVRMWRSRIEHLPKGDGILHARELIEIATEEATNGDMDDAWKALHETQRLVIAASSAEVQEATRLALREETAKLRAWRGNAVTKLLEGKSTENLVEALRITHEHSDNLYFRNRLLRRQVFVLLIGLVASMATLLIALAKVPAILSDDGTMTLVSAARSLLLGAVGACLSALMTFSNASTNQTIPERLANVWVTIARPLIGAASGFVGLVMLSSHVLNAGFVSAWVVPFLFGFSERFLLGALPPPSKDTDK